VPSHRRMRAVDRDLIRGGHYGQRSCEPHLKAEHMAAPDKSDLAAQAGFGVFAVLDAALDQDRVEEGC
jgi:hypothetical protein